jgi:Domain of unknown function (DUF6458)
VRKSTGLTLIALGTILAFAVRGHPSFLNIQLVGWVLMLTGLAGLRVPQGVYGWLRSHRAQLKNALDRAMNPPATKRVPLDSLLRPGPSPSRAPGHPG